MPLDKTGRFHPNTQKAMAADKMPSPSVKQPLPPPAPDPLNEPGEVQPEGGSIGADLMAQAHAAEPGKHMHVKANEMGGYTTHHVAEDGNVEGPTEHENVDALKQHVDRFFEEEGAEPDEGKSSSGFKHLAHEESLSGI